MISMFWSQVAGFMKFAIYQILKASDKQKHQSQKGMMFQSQYILTTNSQDAMASTIRYALIET